MVFLLFKNNTRFLEVDEIRELIRLNVDPNFNLLKLIMLKKYSKFSKFYGKYFYKFNFRFTELIIFSVYNASSAKQIFEFFLVDFWIVLPEHLADIYLNHF